MSRSLALTGTNSGFIRKSLYSSDTLDIIVGTDDQKKTFQSHRNVLISKSQYFRDQLKNDRSISSFTFHDEDPEIYERVQAWIYSGDILLSREEAKGQDDFYSSAQTVTFSTKLAEEEVKEEDEEDERPRKKIKYTPQHRTANDDYDDDDGGDDGFDGVNVSQDEPASEDFIPFAQEEPSYPLDSLTLTKLYVLAECLDIPALCKEVMGFLRQRLEHDLDMLGDILIYTFQRCHDAKNALRQVLTTFAAESASMDDLKEQLGPDSLSQALMHDLYFELLVKMGKLRARSKSVEL